MTNTESIDLNAIVQRMSDLGRRGRTEATVQSDIRLLLIAAGLNLTEHDVLDVELEAQVGDRKRIDIEMGRTVIEVKKSLASSGAVDEAALQLGGYVVERSRSIGQRYVGLVTDGRSWHLFHNDNDTLAPVSAFHVDVDAPSAAPLVEWIASVLTTEERVIPTAAAIANRLGADSPGHELERASLRALYDANRDNPELAIKRELWAKLLTTALGTQFRADDEDLFIEHTLLVATAECIAHAVLEFPISDLSPASLLGGDLFSRESQISGVVEHDFFDWPLDCGPDGMSWVRALARRLEQFDWSAVNHDAMKTIYESVIKVETRRRLGEYYTPDFLAEAVVAQAVTDPLEQRVMDPSCGSGTFLFHAVRAYLTAADDAGHANADAVAGVANHVFGVDVHPVAVTLARVTYLLAIGTDRLSAPDRGPLRIPVFLGDSVQWGQRDDLFASETLNVDTDDGIQLFADQLRFPQNLLDDADNFDQLVSDLSDLATGRERGSAVPDLGRISRRHGLSGADLDTITATFEVLCRLHDERRNHIWGYFVRNLARPAWLARETNRLDVLVGNPPWLAYRFMTDAMKNVFQTMSKERRLWSGKHVATHQDLADLFIARAVEQYLRVGGQFAFVMPAGVLTRGQSDGLRSGDFAVTGGGGSKVTYTTPWDLSPISHRFFPRTACVLFGARGSQSGRLPDITERWTGTLRDPSAPWSAVEPAIVRSPAQAIAASEDDEVSEYKKRFANGANVYPRVLLTVQPDVAPRLGAGMGRQAVKSDKGIYPKGAWKTVDELHGVIESQFVHELLLGESIMPYQQRPPLNAVLPIRNNKMMNREQIENHDGLDNWWSTAEALWYEHRTTAIELVDHVDHYSKLSSQLPFPAIRVVYGASGMHVTACRVTSPHAVVEHQLNWATANSVEEANYLCAVLNSIAVTKAAEPYMVSGKGGGRHISSHLWKVPIPLFDPDDDLHLQLAHLGHQAEQIVEALDIPVMKAHGTMRSRIRKHLATSDVGQTVETAVAELLL